MIRKILLVIVLVFLITGIGFASQDEIAFKNEPDGFKRELRVHNFTFSIFLYSV